MGKVGGYRRKGSEWWDDEIKREVEKKETCVRGMAAEWKRKGF